MDHERLSRKMLSVLGCLWFLLAMVAVILWNQRPHYANTIEYRDAHDSWEMTYQVVMAIGFFISLGIVQWFNALKRSLPKPAPRGSR